MFKFCTITLIFATSLNVFAGDRTEQYASKIEKLQEPWTKMFLANGKRCIKGWEIFEKEYPSFIADLKQLARQSHEIFSAIGTEVSVSKRVPTDVEWSLDEICSEIGTTVAKTIEPRFSFLLGSMTKVKNQKQMIIALQSRAMQKFKVEAAKSYQWAWSCMKKEYYEESATVTFGHPHPYTGQMLDSGFAQLIVHTEKWLEALEEEHEDLTAFNAWFAKDRVKCQTTSTR